MTLRDLHYRLEHAGWVCTPCGLLYGTRRRKGTVDAKHGHCHVCDAIGRVRPVDVFSDLNRGRELVGRMAGGQMDEPTVLSLLDRRRLAA